MKRKPDVMATLIIVFCVGLVISGFTTFSYTRETSKAPASLLPSVSAASVVSLSPVSIKTPDKGYQQQ